MTRPPGVLLAALLLAACVSGRTPPPVQLDPSNPDAPSSAPTAATATLSAEPLPARAPAEQPPAAASDHAQHGSAGASVYACPMHPEVTDTKPSRCPKCGMTLVAQEPAPAPAAPDARAASGTPDAGAALYACPMHPEVTDTKPGRCPKCGMKLVPQKAPEQPDAGHAGHEGHGAEGGSP